MPDDDPPRNPFVRWKQHVDAHIGLTLNSLLGIPAVMSKSLNLGRDDEATGGVRGNASNSSNSSSAAPTSQHTAAAQSTPNVARPYSDATTTAPSSIAPTGSASLASAGSLSAPNSANTAPASGDNNNNDAPNDNVLDGVDAAQLLEWHKFIYYSPYSPLKLAQHQPQPDEHDETDNWPGFGPFSDQHNRLSHNHHRPFGFCRNRHGRWGGAQRSSGPLPPPVPQDVPFGADPYAFTYADAFEDLLRASSGLPLLDLAARSYRNLRYQMRYGGALEPPYVFFHRMHSERLLDAYFPKGVPAAQAVGDETPTAATGDTYNDSVVQAAVGLAEKEKAWKMEQAEEADEGVVMGRRQEAEDASSDVDQDDYDDWTFGWDDEEEEDKEDEDHRRAAENKDAAASAWPVRPFHVGLFDELDRVFRVLGRIIDEDTADKKGEDKGGSHADNAYYANNESKPPSVEDELYTAVRSAYADAEKSLSTFIKAVTEVGDEETKTETKTETRTETKTESPTETASSAGSLVPYKDFAETTTSSMTASSSSSSSPSPNSLQTIRTSEEHVDVFGNRHVKTEVRRIDSEGREVSRETRYTIRSPSAEEDDEQGKKDGPQAKTERAAEQTEKKAGWFWK